ncbi:hypothetical protein [Streptomyces sp. NBRC 109706]|nr:hypothetical protein [Streptomyces sp. NBRC 109706]
MAGTTAIVTALLGVCAVAGVTLITYIVTRARVETAKIQARASR